MSRASLQRHDLRLALSGLVLAGVAVAYGAEPAGIRVNYLSGATVYVDAGTGAGLAEGDTLEVIRDAGPIAFLVVRYISTRSAACERLDDGAAPSVGDLVRVHRGTGAAAGGARRRDGAAGDAPTAPATVGGRSGGTGRAPDSTPAELSEPAVSRPARPIRGRIGTRFLNVSPEAGRGFSEPALDARLRATDLLGRPVDLEVDLRGRRTFRAGEGGSDGSTSVYRLSASLHDHRRRTTLTLGRQVSPSLAAVSLFDGALAEYARPRWRTGVFLAAQPDRADLGLSTDILEAGLFAAVQNGPLLGSGRTRRWSATLGAIASFDRGRANRHFLFLQASGATRRVNVSLSQEVDVNADWKRDVEDAALSPTSTYATARVEAAPAVTLNGGFDNRRSVRLYRDRVTPETEFDDSYRQGVWAGVAMRLPGRLRLGADGREKRGGPGGAFRSWSASAEAARIPLVRADLRHRATRLVGAAGQGWLHASSATVRIGGRWRAELTAGRRTTEDPTTGSRSRLLWEGLDLDAAVARGWHALASVEITHGDGAEGVQTYTSLAWQF